MKLSYKHYILIFQGMFILFGIFLYVHTNNKIDAALAASNGVFFMSLFSGICEDDKIKNRIRIIIYGFFSIVFYYAVWGLAFIL